MSKLVGVRGRSPETYPQSLGAPTILQTLSGVNAGPVSIGGSFASLLAEAVMFTPDVAGARAVIMFSCVLEAIGAGTVNVAVVLDHVVEFTVTAEVRTAGEATPFSVIFETASLGAAGPHTIDIQAENGTATTPEALDNSVVVIVTSA